MPTNPANRATNQSRGLSKCPLHEKEYSALKTNVPFLVFLELTKAQIILNAFTLRLHVGIGRYTWARLWYLCRGLDIWGRGYAELPIELCCSVLGISSQTLYRWLKDGKTAGAFRKGNIRRGVLRVYLGALHKVCFKLGLIDWEGVVDLRLVEVNQNIRPLVTGACTQDLQSKSHYAAVTNLKKRERAIYAPPKASAILQSKKVSSQKSDEGQILFLLHVGQKRAFVSRSFVPFGASQRSIGSKLGISDRTVRRHQEALGLNRRQLMQAKGEYKRVQQAMKHQADFFQAADDIWLTSCGNEWELQEKSRGAKEWHKSYVTEDSFCNYYDKTWIYRCNLYEERYTLTSMRRSRDIFKRQIQQQPQSTQPVQLYANVSNEEYDRTLGGKANFEKFSKKTTPSDVGTLKRGCNLRPG
ncbi:hypothetical protein [Tolypothrix sp. VBCCA 56010]|uniref:hypothetical protein n=1 Tax=Tolypothrix sp. VBCCA 56010 TaxID=3137731 RepID=UPI003D7E3ECB